MKTELLIESIKKIDGELVNDAQAIAKKSSGGSPWKTVIVASVVVLLVAAGLVTGILLGARYNKNNTHTGPDGQLSAGTPEPDEATPANLETPPDPHKTGAPSDEPTAPHTTGDDNFDNSLFVPDYNSTSTLHTDEFLSQLKQNGIKMESRTSRLDILGNGETITDFNTANITGVFNITPPGILTENADIELFLVKPRVATFLMLNGVIYRFEALGGQFKELYLWDADGNGTKDLVAHYCWGCGSYIESLSIFDINEIRTLLNIDITKPDFEQLSFSFDGNNLFLDNEMLVYTEGRFNIDERGNIIPAETIDEEMFEKPFEIGVLNGNLRFIRIADRPVVSAFSSDIIDYYALRGGVLPPHLTVRDNSSGALHNTIFNALDNKPLMAEDPGNRDTMLLGIILSASRPDQCAYKYLFELYEFSHYGAFARVTDLLSMKKIGCVKLTLDEVHALYTALVPVNGSEMLPTSDIVRIELSSEPENPSYYWDVTDPAAIERITSMLSLLNLSEIDDVEFRTGMAWVLELYHADGSRSTLYDMSGYLNYGGQYYRFDHVQSSALDELLSSKG
jgi:hypothetical protein